MASTKKNAPTRRTGAARTSRSSKGGKNAARETRSIAGELCGLLVIGMALVSFIVLLTTDDSTNFVKALLEGLSGVFAYVTCTILLWIGLLIAFVGEKKLNIGRIVMMAVGILLVFAIVHIFYAGKITESLLLQGGWLNFIEQSFFDRAGTGAIGALLSYPVYAVFGQWAGFVVLLFLLLLDIVLLTKISIRRVGERAQTYLQNNYEDFRQRQSERIQQRQLIREERRQQRENRAFDSWDQPVFAEDPSEPLEPVHSPQKPAADFEQSGDLLEVPDYLKSGTRQRKKPVLGESQGSSPRKSRLVAETPDTGADWELTEPPVHQSSLYGAPFAAQEPDEAPDARAEEPPVDIPDYEAESAQEPIDITDCREIPDQDAVGDEPSEADEPEEPDESLPDDGDLFDGFDSEPDVEPPFEPSSPRERRRPVLGEPLPEPAARTVRQPKPSFTDAPLSDSSARRLDHTPIVMPARDLSHDLTPAGGEYNYPPVDLLAVPKPSQVANSLDKDREKAAKLEETLRSFGISATLTDIAHGPAVTRFELAPAPGVKVSRITSLADDIALNLAAMSVRIEAPIPGKAAVGVEIPNEVIETVPLREVLESPEARKNPSRLAAAMGKDNSGRYIIGDIAKMPHVLIAGATGSGKSVCINCIICSILYRATPDEVRLIMIDPKVVELSIYNGIPHLLVPVVTDPKKAAGALHWAVVEMSDRYKKFADKGVRDIKGYNKACASCGEPMMPQIVIIIDELADLMMVTPGEVEDSICRLAQLARAAGIHLVIATQRPSVNVITGVIKANIPARIAFTVASYVDSRTILDVGGAEKLLGRGDMLFAPAGSNKMQRVQGAWVSDDEIHAIVDYIKNRHEAEYNSDLSDFMENHEADEGPEPEDDAEKESDKLLPQAVEIAINAGQVSISMLQRKLSIGYARAGRLVDEMANRGIVSQSEGAKPRNVLMTREEFAATFGKVE